MSEHFQLRHTRIHHCGALGNRDTSQVRKSKQRDEFVSKLSPTKRHSGQRRRLGKAIETGSHHLSLIQFQRSQSGQRSKDSQSLIGDLRPLQIDRIKLWMHGQFAKPLVGHVRSTQVQILQAIPPGNLRPQPRRRGYGGNRVQAVTPCHVDVEVTGHAY